tara:strand:- start:2963 stop:3256 length:294 start_codon:yes stop_codon:yes gene_type:complete
VVNHKKAYKSLNLNISHLNIEGEGTMSTWLTILIILAAIVLAIVIYFAVKQSPEKFYRKAKRAHKKAEKIYNTGDYDLADEYYQQAEEFRKTAREMS